MLRSRGARWPSAKAPARWLARLPGAGSRRYPVVSLNSGLLGTTRRDIMNLQHHGRWLAFSIIAAIIAGAVLAFYGSSWAQWDFKVYYAAAELHKHGISPYQSANFHFAAGETILYYPYPPYTLFLFYPFTWFDIRTASAIYLTLQILALCALIFVWVRTFNLSSHRMLFFVFVFFAFEGAVIGDLRSGNCCMFEQLIIAIAFYCYTEGKIGWFSAAIVVAASLKLAPILLLGLLLTSGRKREVLYCVVFGMVFLLLLALTAAIWPHLFPDFIHAVGRLEGERALLNPATWPLVCDIASAIQQAVGIQVPAGVKLLAFLLIVAAVISVSLCALKRFARQDSPGGQLWRICLVCLAYGIIVPRFKNYTYILLVGPAFYVVMTSRLPSPRLLACAILMMSTYRGYDTFGRVLEPFYWLTGEYYPLLLAWLLWGLCCYSMAVRTQGASFPDAQSAALPQADLK